MELENRIEIMEEKLEQTHQLVKEVEDKQEETHKLVKEIHTIVIGTEYNRNDSMLVKMVKIQSEIDTLKIDKIKREAKLKILFAIGVSVGTIVGGVITAVIANLLLK